MVRIGVLSDTHGVLDDRVLSYLNEVDEVWHAGDVGSEDVLRKLTAHKTTRAVYGNIDGQAVRQLVPEYQVFMVEQVKVLIIHIGGYPGKYAAGVRLLLAEHQPDIFVSGHSHILKVIHDKKYNVLHINPGAAGNHGFHQVKTLIRFTIDGKTPRDLEVIEIPRNE